MNEERQTLNHELEAKLEDLRLAGDDMKNAVDSTDVTTLFPDDASRGWRFVAGGEPIVATSRRELPGLPGSQ